MSKVIFLSTAMVVWAAADPQSLRDCGMFVVDAACGAGRNIWALASTQVMGWFV